MAKILVTGGPVHTHLDAVKIITNKFKGGRIKALAIELGKRGHDVLCVMPEHLTPKPGSQDWDHVKWVAHRGFESYREIVLRCAPEHDMTILGAAVANLIPKPSWDVEKKFPSHNYREGDQVMVPFEVAPRIINQVKKVAPKTTLVGFKYLKGVGAVELTRAAYTVIRESGASFVIANDGNDLFRKTIVTKEQSLIDVVDVVGELEKKGSLELIDFLDEAARDEYYHSRVEDDNDISLSGEHIFDVAQAIGKYERLVKKYSFWLDNASLTGTTGFIFGCIAVVVENGGFLVSRRGKKSLGELPVYVDMVEHDKRCVWAREKASLNAPLLDWIFAHRSDVKAIVHTHLILPSAECLQLDYAHPGTVRDSQRKELIDFDGSAFQIKAHGSFELLTKEEVENA